MEPLEQRNLLYAAPVGGWTYEFEADAGDDDPGFGGFTALDGTWNHDNGSDAWDGTPSGDPGGAPGGAGIFEEGGVSYLRIEDTGNPVNDGFPDPSNRKVYLLHDTGSDPGTTSSMLDDGVTLNFRTRIPGVFAEGSIDGLTEDGYLLHNGGKSFFGIRQSGGTAAGLISFAPAFFSDDFTILDNVPGTHDGGLVMNNLAGNAPTGNVDTGNANATAVNIVPIEDWSAWHDFWITIEAGGSGTHVVNVYMDGSFEAQTFDVTLGNGNDGGGASYLTMGLGSTGQSGVIDTDFFHYRAGAFAPIDPTAPEIVNTSASDVDAVSAALGGEVTQSAGLVTVYYGTTDGGTDVGAWEASIDAGPQGANFAVQVEGLAPTTDYFYRSFVKNDVDQAWAPSSATFTTLPLSLPAIQTDAAASVSSSSASLGGTVTGTGNDAPEVTLYYGKSDGGTDENVWDASISLGTQTASFSATVSGLDPLTTYFFRAQATNTAGESWAGSTLSFTTLDASKPLYEDPTGGWAYRYNADFTDGEPGAGFTALDGTWSHDNGSDQWDESPIGQGNPGGVNVDDDSGTGYLRIQDTGDPRDHGFGDPGSNRKMYFGHDIGADGAEFDVLDAGATITFRTRLATGAGLDQIHPDGGGLVEDWPTGGDGGILHDGGKGHFTIHQESGGTISFALALTTDHNDIEINDDYVPGDGGALVMNNLNGFNVSGDVDWQGDGPGDRRNLISVTDPTEWQEYWITIELDFFDGIGTHIVNVYTNGSTEPQTFFVTAGSGSDFGGSYIAMGAGATPQSAAFDVDYFAFQPGVIEPTVADVVDVPGDVNGDSSVNELDFRLLANSFGKSGATRSEGDLTGDGNVGLGDLIEVQANFEPVAVASPQLAPLSVTSSSETESSNGSSLQIEFPGSKTDPSSIESTGTAARVRLAKSVDATLAELDVATSVSGESTLSELRSRRAIRSISRLLRSEPGLDETGIDKIGPTD